MSKDYEEFIEKNIKSKNLDLNSVEVTIDISMYPNKEDLCIMQSGNIRMA